MPSSFGSQSSSNDNRGELLSIQAMIENIIEQADGIDHIVRAVISDYLHKNGYSVVKVTRELKEFENYCWVQWDGETSQPGGLLVTLIYNPSKNPNMLIAVGEHPATGPLTKINLQEVIETLERDTGIQRRSGWIHK